MHPNQNVSEHRDELMVRVVVIEAALGFGAGRNNNHYLKDERGCALFFASADFLNHDNMTVMLFSSQTLL
jgi:hypothetical protein